MFVCKYCENTNMPFAGLGAYVDKVEFIQIQSYSEQLVQN